MDDGAFRCEIEREDWDCEVVMKKFTWLKFGAKVKTPNFFLSSLLLNQPTMFSKFVLIFVRTLRIHQCGISFLHGNKFFANSLFPNGVLSRIGLQPKTKFQSNTQKCELKNRRSLTTESEGEPKELGTSFSSTEIEISRFGSMKYHSIKYEETERTIHFMNLIIFKIACSSRLWNISNIASCGCYSFGSCHHVDLMWEMEREKSCWWVKNQLFSLTNL